MPKKYTATEDGWIKVEETDDNLDKLLNEVNQMIGQEAPKNAQLQQTQKLPNVHEAAKQKVVKPYTKATPVNDKKDKKPTKKKKEKEDWERDADRAALWCLVFVFGFLALIIGVMAGLVYLGPFTWDSLAEAIVVLILKALWWAYETFTNLCIKLFEWILSLT